MSAEPLLLDVRGRPCPIPVIELADALRDAPVGTVVDVLSDDPAAKVDIPVWCRMQRQRLVSQEVENGAWRFRVEKVVERG